jgi:hypothetical protein
VIHTTKLASTTNGVAFTAETRPKPPACTSACVPSTPSCLRLAQWDLETFSFLLSFLSTLQTLRLFPFLPHYKIANHHLHSSPIPLTRYSSPLYLQSLDARGSSTNRRNGIHFTGAAGCPKTTWLLTPSVPTVTQTQEIEKSLSANHSS